MVDRDFGNWLAGFIDGEGCFYITRDSKRSVWRARFSMSLRSDDRAILEDCQRLTGLGTIHNYATPQGSTVARWMIQSRPDCEALAALMQEFPLRAKKRHDFEVWREAVNVQKNIRAGRADNSAVVAQMSALKDRLAEVRRAGL